jgi:succinylglutamic semialdehyde dehydrogenase
MINNHSFSLGSEFNSLNPASQEIIWHGKAADKEEVHKNIETAHKAFKYWSRLHLDKRLEYIKKFIDILTINKDEYAKIISLEMGKPLWEAKTEVSAMIAKYDASIKSYHSRTGSYTTTNSMLIHKAIGVMLVFGPFNFPGHLPNGHILPALIAGNTVIFKPSELTPLCGEWMAKYWLEAGLPPGVFNLVQGGADVGKELINYNIDGVLFTGSYNTGKLIHQQLAGRPEVLLALEMGGNNPLIIDNEINNLQAAVYNTIQSAFITSGQRCTCARRLYIPDSDFGKIFLDKLIEVTINLALGDGYNTKNIDNFSMSTAKEPFMGPVVALNAANNILNFKNNLLQNNNYTELVELSLIADNSALLSPGILLNNNKNYNNINDTECFGPLLQIFYYDRLSDAIDAANYSKYGLSAGLLSDNKNNFELFYNLIRAGIVNWNKPTTGAVGSLPFGGVGHSGNYRPGAAYAADYCSYPMASQYADKLELPESLSPGVAL